MKIIQMNKSAFLSHIIMLVNTTDAYLHLWHLNIIIIIIYILYIYKIEQLTQMQKHLWPFLLPLHSSAASKNLESLKIIINHKPQFVIQHNSSLGQGKKGCSRLKGSSTRVYTRAAKINYQNTSKCTLRLSGIGSSLSEPEPQELEVVPLQRIVLYVVYSDLGPRCHWKDRSLPFYGTVLLLYALDCCQAFVFVPLNVSGS